MQTLEEERLIALKKRLLLSSPRIILDGDKRKAAMFIADARREYSELLNYLSFRHLSVGDRKIKLSDTIGISCSVRGLLGVCYIYAQPVISIPESAVIPVRKSAIIAYGLWTTKTYIRSERVWIEQEAPAGVIAGTKWGYWQTVGVYDDNSEFRYQQEIIDNKVAPVESGPFGEVLYTPYTMEWPSGKIDEKSGTLASDTPEADKTADKATINITEKRDKEFSFTYDNITAFMTALSEVYYLSVLVGGVKYVIDNSITGLSTDATAVSSSYVGVSRRVSSITSNSAYAGYNFQPFGIDIKRCNNDSFEPEHYKIVVCAFKAYQNADNVASQMNQTLGEIYTLFEYRLSIAAMNAGIGKITLIKKTDILVPVNISFKTTSSISSLTGYFVSGLVSFGLLGCRIEDDDSINVLFHKVVTPYRDWGSGLWTPPLPGRLIYGQPTYHLYGEAYGEVEEYISTYSVDSGTWENELYQKYEAAFTPMIEESVDYHNLGESSDFDYSIVIEEEIVEQSFEGTRTAIMLWNWLKREPFSIYEELLPSEGLIDDEEKNKASVVITDDEKYLTCLNRSANIFPFLSGTGLSIVGASGPTPDPLADVHHYLDTDNNIIFKYNVRDFMSSYGIKTVISGDESIIMPGGYIEELRPYYGRYTESMHFAGSLFNTMWVEQPLGEVWSWAYGANWWGEYEREYTLYNYITAPAKFAFTGSVMNPVSGMDIRGNISYASNEEVNQYTLEAMNISIDQGGTGFDKNRVRVPYEEIKWSDYESIPETLTDGYNIVNDLSVSSVFPYFDNVRAVLFRTKDSEGNVIPKSGMIAYSVVEPGVADGKRGCTLYCLNEYGEKFVLGRADGTDQFERVFFVMRG